MAKTGAPTKYRPEVHIPDFIEQSKQGRNITQIAARWDIDKDTIYEWGKRHKEFSVALKKGRQLCEAWYTNLGQAAMMGQAKIDGKITKIDLGWYVWMTKNICKWSDKAEQKDTTPPEKKKLKVEVDVAAQVKDILAKLKDEY